MASSFDVRAAVERWEHLATVWGDTVPDMPGTIVGDLILKEMDRLEDRIWASRPTTDQDVLSWKLKRLASLLDTFGMDVSMVLNCKHLAADLRAIMSSVSSQAA